MISDPTGGNTVKDAPMDEPMPELDDDLEPTRDHKPQQDDGPSIVAGVGSSGLGSTDLEPDEDEPQSRRHPDNDGETVEG
jgi:hypothetical protein